MDDWALQFVDWVYQNYGRVGCLVLLVIILSALGLGFYFLNKLPKSKSGGVSPTSFMRLCKTRAKRLTPSFSISSLPRNRQRHSPGGCEMCNTFHEKETD